MAAWASASEVGSGVRHDNHFVGSRGQQSSARPEPRAGVDQHEIEVHAPARGARTPAAGPIPEIAQLVRLACAPGTTWMPPGPGTTASESSQRPSKTSPRSYRG